MLKRWAERKPEPPVRREVLNLNDYRHVVALGHRLSRSDEPVDLYVNGAPFAKGRLVLVGGTDWAVRIESFHNTATSEAGSATDLAAEEDVDSLDQQTAATAG